METIVEKLSAIGFNPEAYVRDLTRNSLGVDILLSTKQKVQQLSDETNGLLKKNVYKNYMQFIETAKEISYLESEMYQLSHMLTEQQQVINALFDISITGAKVSTSSEQQVEKDEESSVNLSTVLEKVEGCASILDVRGRYLVHSGEVIESDINDSLKVQKVYMVLLNDSLMLATALTNRRGPVQFKFHNLYELDSLAVVNVTDDPLHKNAFKVLMFPDTRFFHCETAQAKKDWLEVIERMKKEKVTPTTLRRESFILESRNPFYDCITLYNFSGKSGKPGRTPTLNVRMLMSLVDESGFSAYEEGDQDNENEMPEWLLELPEELDACIAQRAFEGAVELIQKAGDPKVNVSKEIRSRIDHRIKHLVDVLKNELRVTPDKSLQGGPRAARRAVLLLIQLGKSSQACSLFLRHRSAIMRQSMRQQKVEGATTPYINRLCIVFFNNMQDTGREFSRAFGNNQGCASAFVIWSRTQLQNFLQTFSRHVFTVQVTLTVAADCIAMLRQRCQLLTDIGLDLTFQVERSLSAELEQVVLDGKGKLLEAVKLRAQDDLWRPHTHSSKQAVQKFLDELAHVGIASVQNYIYDECCVSLTSNTTSFSKAYLHFLDDLLKLYTPTMHHLICDALIETFSAQLRHIQVSLTNPNFISETKFIQRNATFLLETLLTLAEHRFEKKVGQPCGPLGDLHNRLPELTASNPKAKTPTAPPRSSVTKYSSSAFV